MQLAYMRNDDQNLLCEGNRKIDDNKIKFRATVERKPSMSDYRVRS